MIKRKWTIRWSTVKDTTPLPYIGSSESDSKLYTNFEFVKEKLNI